MCEWYMSSTVDLPPSSSLHKVFNFAGRFFKKQPFGQDEPYKTHFIPCIVVIFCIPFAVLHLKSYWNHDLTDVSLLSLMMDSKHQEKTKKNIGIQNMKTMLLSFRVTLKGKQSKI